LAKIGKVPGRSELSEQPGDLSLSARGAYLTRIIFRVASNPVEVILQK
jgi:hypothetical protein